MAAETLCIVGESGSGKSTSLRHLDPETTFIIATVPKPLPFKGWKKKFTPVKAENGKMIGNYFVASNWEKILNMLKLIDKKMPHVKTIIIDDKI